MAKSKSKSKSKKKAQAPTASFPQWSRLPHDCKIEIVHWLYMLECAIEATNGPPLIAAMLVSEEVHDLAARFFWREVFFTGRPLASMRRFVDEGMMLKYGPHINRATFPVTVESGLRPRHRQPQRLGPQQPRIDPEAAERRIIYCSILENTPNLTSINLGLRLDVDDNSEQPTLFSRGFGAVEAPEHHGELLVAIAATVGPQLKVIELYSTEEHPMDPVPISTFLSACPKLIGLYLTAVSECATDTLLTAVQSLSHLHTLEVNGVMDIDSRWATSPNWTAPIQVIHAHNLLEMTASEYALFFSHFSSTLVQIRVHHDIPLSAPAVPTHLPHLIWLTVWSGNNVLGFVDSFAGSPLKRLEIDSQHEPIYRNPTGLLQTADLFKTTLEELSIYSPVPRGVVESWGRTNRVEVDIDYRAF